MRPQWSDVALDALRERGDPEADALVERHAQAFGAYVRLLTVDRPTNATPLPPELPADLRDFLGRNAALPEWADPAAIARGHHLFGRFGMLLVVGLLCSSLPECYAAVKGANILYLSRRLTAQTPLRVLETAQFVLDVMAPGAFEPSGRGIRTAQTIRLVHALSRHHFLKHPEYDRAWGVPINQEDGIATLVAFSVLALQALKRLGANFTQEEEDSYEHAWRVVGTWLGLDAATLPKTFAEGVHYFEIMRRRHHGPSEAGKAMTRSLIAHLEDVVPGTAFDGFVTVLFRRVLDPEVADLLGVPPEDWTRVLFKPFQSANWLVDRAGDRSPLLAKAVEKFCRRLLKVTYSAFGGSESIRFHVPATLSAAWGVPAD